MSKLKDLLKKLPMFAQMSRNLRNQVARDEFVIMQLKGIKPGSALLDVGCGRQPYRIYCSHLNYFAQDFGEYKNDEKATIGGYSGGEDYKYGQLDYVGNVWEIDAKDATFDVILCTEVFEHIPYPIAAVKEFSRLLKSGGTLILTAPSNCLRHMDPYYFYSGFSDRWYEAILPEHGFTIEQLDPVGDYYRWLAVEIYRTSTTKSFFEGAFLAPAFVFLYNQRKTEISVDTLCMGYHVVAKKL